MRNVIPIARTRLFLTFVSLTLFLAPGCNNAKFSADRNKTADPPPEPTPVPEPTPPPSEPICTPTQQKIGPDLVIMLDNSGSNAETDCPGAYQDQDRTRCTAATEREKAVLLAYDQLASSQSHIAIASFPSRADTIGGWQIQGFEQSGGWAVASSDQDVKAAFAERLLFTREPFGSTPFGGAVEAATRLFGSVDPSTQRPKLALLITDGEPTDKNPTAVASAAASLQKSGVAFVTVFITRGAERKDRRAAHVDMLSDERQGGPWWQPSPEITTFETYIDYLLGPINEETPSLAQRLSSLQDPTCVDAVGAVCARKIIEVQDAAALSDVIKNIVKTATTGCGK